MRAFVPTSLRARLLLVVFVAGLPIVALTLTAHIQQHRHALAELRRTALRTMTGVAAEQQRTVETSRQLLESIGRLPQVREHRPSCPGLLDELHRAYPSFTNIGVVDSEGNTFCAAARETHDLVCSRPEWFRRAVAERSFVIGDLEVRSVTNERLLMLASPVMEGDRVVAVVFAGLDVRWFNRSVQDADVSPGAVTMVLDHKGSVALRELAGGGALPPGKPEPELTRAVQRERRGSIELAGPDGVSRFYAFAPWGSSGANEKYVVIGFPEKGAIHALNATLAWNVLGLVAVIGITAVFVNRASDALLVRPVRHLISVTNHLTSGDLTVRASSLGHSELAGLAGSLNDLAEALDQRRRERDAADAALNEAQSRLTQIVETVPLGIFVTDPAGHPRLVNRAARAMFGTASVSLSLRNTVEQLGLRHASTGAPVTHQSCPVLRALKGEHVHSTDFEGVRDGRSVPYEIWAAPIFDASLQVTCAVLAVHDLTEQRGLEEQYRQAQKMEAVGRLAGGVAHDFNNLLTVILGYADMLLEDCPAETALTTDLKAIRDAGERARALTQQLLAFSRKQVLRPRVVNLNGLLHQLARMLQRLLGEDVDLLLHLSPVPDVSVDPGQFDQIVMNLAVNARDAMPDGGTLSLETSVVAVPGEDAAPPDLAPGEYVMVAFRDTGVGMSEATRALIFEPFFTTKERGKGTGLGLATVYGIVRQSGGSISVESRLGHGSAFRIYLPVAHADRPAASTDRSEQSRLDGRETILVVEDDAEVRRFATRVLRQHGYAVLEADGADAAMAIVRAHRGSIDLVLTDIVLKGVNGRRLADAIVRLRPDTVPVFMSGYTDNALVDMSAQDESVHFLQKPFTPTQLATAVRTFLDVDHPAQPPA